MVLIVVERGSVGSSGGLVQLDALGYPEARAPARTFRAFHPRTGEVVVVQRRTAGPVDPDELAACRALDPARGARFLGGGDMGNPDVFHTWVAGLGLGRLRSEDRLSIDVATVLAFELTTCVATLHAQGLVHGDLHPDNVRIRPSGNLRLVGHRPGEGPTPRPEEKLPRYQAPEVLAGGAPSAAADVYSLGLLLFELFVGKRLFPRADLATHQNRQRKLEGVLAKTVRMRQSLPEALAQLLEVCLRHAREGRPQSALPLRKKLGEMIGNERRLEAARVHLRPRIQPLFQQASLSLSRRASEKALEDSAVAASLLLRATEFGAEPDPLLVEPLREAARDVVWSMASPPPEPGRFQAAAVMLHRALGQIGSRSLQSLLGARLGREPGLAEKLRPLLEPHDLAPSTIPEASALRRRLGTHPGDEVAALALVLQELATPPALLGSPHAMRAICLERVGAPAAALIYQARELAAAGSTPEILDKLAALTRAAQESRIPEPPPPPPPPEEEVEELLSAAPALVTDDEELEAPPPLAEEPSEPSSPITEVRTPDFFEDAQEHFEEGQRRIEQGNVDRAVRAFKKLIDLGDIYRERYLGPLSGAVRDLAWHAMVRSKGGRGDPEAMAQLLGFAEQLGATELVPVLERLAVRAIPDEYRGEDVAALLVKRPRSPGVLQAALQVARDKGNKIGIGLHLVALGTVQLERGEVAAATRAFREAEALGSGEAKRSMAKVLEAGGELANAASDFRTAEATAKEAESPQAVVEVLQAFLKEHPNYEPALAYLATATQEAGDAVGAARLELGLARRALLRGEPAAAQKRLEAVLEVAPERDVVMLCLAALARPFHKVPGSVLEVKMLLLLGEELLKPAAHIARAELGKGRDREVLAWLAKIADRDGDDPSPFHIERGKLAQQEGDEDEAREAFEAALASPFKKKAIAEKLLQMPEALAVFKTDELLEYRA